MVLVQVLHKIGIISIQNLFIGYRNNNIILIKFSKNN